MLNTLWAGLIIISIVFAAGNDIRDEINNTYGNGIPLKVSYVDNTTGADISLLYRQWTMPARITGNEIIIDIKPDAPENWRLIAEQQTGNDRKFIHATVLRRDAEKTRLTLQLPELHWTRMNALTRAAFDTAEFAVKLAIGLAGIMAMWLGLMQIAEKSGLIRVFVRLVYPLVRWLFPQLPRDHPVIGSISLNLAANVLGLGNAATPLGIKAMQQLQELNEKKHQASDAMCMFLALNTSSVQLLPPVTLIAVMGSSVTELMLPIVMATTASTAAAILAVKIFMRNRRQ